MLRAFVRMVALENAVDECPVDRPALHFLELGEFLGALRERGTAFTGPHESVERKPRYALGVPLSE